MAAVTPGPMEGYPGPVHERQRVLVNPLKFREHGRFPCALCLHFALVWMVTCQLMHFLSRDVEHAQRTIHHMSKLLLGVPSGTVSVTGPQDLQKALFTAVDSAFTIEDYSMTPLYFGGEGEILVELGWRHRSSQRVSLHRDLYAKRGFAYLSEALPGLLGNRSSGGASQIPRLGGLALSFKLEEPDEAGDGHCYNWRVRVHFDGRARGLFVCSLHTNIGTCGNRHDVRIDVLSLTVVVFALASFACIVPEACRALLNYRRSCRPPFNAPEQAMNCCDALTFFNPWWGISALAHVLQIVSTITCLSHTSSIRHRFAALGWSSFFTWITLCQYLEHFPGYYTPFATISTGFSRVFKFMISVLPMLSAFAFLATGIFWETEFFDNPNDGFVSLYSLLNGDIVHDSFETARKGAGWIGTVYVYTFIVIFMYIVLRVNIMIVQEAFYETRQKSEMPASTLADGRPGAVVSGTNPDAARAEYASDFGHCRLGTGRDGGEVQETPGSAAPESVKERGATAGEGAALELSPFGVETSSWNERQALPRNSSSGHPSGSRLLCIPSAALPSQSAGKGSAGCEASDLQLPSNVTTPDKLRALCKETTSEGGGDDRGSVGREHDAAWWAETLAGWVTTLRSAPLPCRGDAVDELVWQELRQRLAGLCPAAQEAVGRLSAGAE